MKVKGRIMRKVKEKLSKIIYNIRTSKYRNTKLAKVSPIIVIALTITALFVFNYLFNTYKVVITTDSDGYFIGTSGNPEKLKSNAYEKAEEYFRNY